MPGAFVWYHNESSKPAESRGFYEKLLGWKGSDGPGGLTLLAGEGAPFAGLAAQEGPDAGWVPYVQVADVDAAARQAVALGARIARPRRRGPAGDYVVIQDPGGASLALWQPA